MVYPQSLTISSRLRVLSYDENAYISHKCQQLWDSFEFSFEFSLNNNNGSLMLREYIVKLIGNPCTDVRESIGSCIAGLCDKIVKLRCW